MRYCRSVLVVFSAGWLVVGLASAQTAQEKNQEAYIDLMRKDIRTQKQAIVDQGMELEAAQKAQFWQIYDGYQAALNAIWDQRIANIKKYADNYDKMTGEVADQLAVKLIDLEGQRTALKKKYYEVYKQKMGALIAARFLQLETTLAAFMDLQIGSELPIIR